jgi:predicted MPP superfamily phosphohydrolase
MMTALFSLILAGYAALPFYFFRKINAAFKPPGLVRALLGLFLMLMAVAPFMARYLDHDGHAAIARVINLPVFIWIAWLFWFMVAGLLLDLWNLVVRRLGRDRPSWSKLHIRPRSQVQGLLIAIMLATAWSLVEAARPRIREITIHHPALSAIDPIRVVQVSDVHLGMLRSRAWNRIVCKSIEGLKPDILVSTGDLVDTSMKNIGDQADPWAALQPRLGKFAVLGNHEYYLGLADSLAFHSKAGFQLLRGETVSLSPSLQISGVDDKDGQRLGLPCYREESKLNPSPDTNRFSVLLKHQPILTEGSPQHFNLQLSGHTHGGQLFPFQGFVMLFYPHWSGLHTLTDTFQLYVSNGTGTWGPPLRLFAAPEITVFTLTR